MSDQESTGDKPKIIIDEDWKSQVQAEKEAASEPPTAASTEADAQTSSAQAAEPNEPGTADDPQMPPASLEMLLTTLATEAMMSLGQLPHPVTGETVVRRNQAKYLIDTIEVVKEKTAGNLSDEEDKGLEGLLHQLRMAFVATK